MPENALFSNTKVTTSRIIYTPSAFARANLLHLQETGTLTANMPHVSRREGLRSYLFFIVVSGKGKLTYSGVNYDLSAGDCVFIDCHNAYSQCSDEELWTLKWVHFYGANMSAIYAKYVERGGKPVFHAGSSDEITNLLQMIYDAASSSSYIRDMIISEKLNSLMTILMSETLSDDSPALTKDKTHRKIDVANVKQYLDEHYSENISLDLLSGKFFVNKYYLIKTFKSEYGTTVLNYILRCRITKAKGMLRFSDKSIEEIAINCGFESGNYFARAFKKVEGMSPNEYRKKWQSVGEQ